MAKMRLPNGFGSISKLSGKRRNPFMVRKTKQIREDGSVEMMCVGYYRTYTEAMEALLKYNETGVLKVKRTETFEDVYEASRHDRFDKTNRSIPTTYKTAYKRCESLYKRLFTSITLKDLDDVMDLAPSPSTKRDLKLVLSMMFKYALKYDIVEKNLAERLDNPTIQKSTMHKPFTDDEIKILWKNTDKWSAKIWLIYIYTGLRPIELLLIKTENVHIDEQYMVGGVKTEHSKNRIIPIADCILPFVKEFYDSQNLYLIPNKAHPEKPMIYRTLTKKMLQFNTDNNIHHKPHDARHTCATLLDRIGTNIAITKKILGHSLQEEQGITGEVYIHKSIEDFLEAVNKLPHYEQTAM